ncbi:MAG: acetylxylan esterase [Planctomycetaceae bacterium]|nr:acetylxylan esterase [Planctomycetaceae bacterium]
MIADYFLSETALLSHACLQDIDVLADWTSRRDEYRRQLREMLGLDPLPERTPLQPVVTGKVEHAEFTVEKLHFQSRPGLYVTGNLYVPKGLTEPAPAILYVCGHSKVKEGDVSLGNKTYYQHHGGWFARNGYVCLTIDTIELGEIEGVHHGTYNLKQWWWNARGYTPAGVEAWNGIRALDYLESRPEVDGNRLGVTGRSGGGATSWWVAALDERVKVAVPVAGITDLENHVVDGTVEGHCDCMFPLNTYRWDFAQVATLVAPRPLLISNTDKDTIFPLEGVVRIHDKVRRIYRLYGAEKNLGLQITEGPHADTQELHLHAFRWFNRFLKNDSESQVEKTAVKFFKPVELRVFERLPSDEIVTTVQQTFTAVAPPPTVPESDSDWNRQRNEWLADLREKVFRGWPEQSTGDAKTLDLREAFAVEAQGIRLAAWDFTSQHGVRLRLYIAHRAGLKADELELVVLNALDQLGWTKWLASLRPGFADELKDEQLPEADAAEFGQTKKMFESFKWGMAWIAPRGIGPTAWDQSERKQTQIRRRFQLLGQTLDGMRVWDVRRAAQALRAVDGFGKVPLWMQGEREMSGIVLYASLFEPDVARLDLWHLPESHQNGPDFLNVLRVFDLPAALAMATERSKVRVYQTTPAARAYPQQVATKLGWPEKQLQIRVVPGAKLPSGTK